MKRPQVIFFDAVGTLFGVRGSVGDVYQSLALRHGVRVEAEAVNRAFYRCFKAAPPCAFPGMEADLVPALEYQWWETIALQTFQAVGAWERFADFAAFFAEVYAHFETADPWIVYADVLPTLHRLHQLKLPLGIISNFDSRLHKVLPALGLAEFFSSVTISTEVGVAKPDAQIFAIALAKHQCEPAAAWHIGDSRQEDYEAAKAVGMRGVLLNRRD